MELRHLRYFVTLAEELHFARAAEVLGSRRQLSPSRSRRSSARCPPKLFTRTKRSVALTPRPAKSSSPKPKTSLLQFAKRRERWPQGRSRRDRQHRGRLCRLRRLCGESFSSKQACSGGPGRASILTPVSCPWRIFRVSSMKDMSTSASSACRFDPSARLRKHILVARPFLRRLSVLTIRKLRSQARYTHEISRRQLSSRPSSKPARDEVARRGKFEPNIISAPGSLLAVLTQVSLGAGISDRSERPYHRRSHAKRRIPAAGRRNDRLGSRGHLQSKRSSRLP